MGVASDIAGSIAMIVEICRRTLVVSNMAFEVLRV